MAAALNKVMLIGNLGRDPECNTLHSGDKVVKLSIATSESWTDRNSGERKERTEWHRVVIFNQALAGVAERYLRKGGKVYIEGALQTRKWTDQQNIERYSTEVVLNTFGAQLVLLGGGDGTRNGDPGPSPDDYGSAASRSQQTASPQPAAGQGGTRNNDLDDEIPF